MSDTVEILLLKGSKHLPSTRQAPPFRNYQELASQCLFILQKRPIGTVALSLSIGAFSVMNVQSNLIHHQILLLEKVFR